jgi:hypothetical protein
MRSLQPSWILAAVPLLLGTYFAGGQNPPPGGPNSNPAYQQLRNIGLTGESFAVHDLDVKRDAATFHLRSGTVCFIPAVENKVTGAVFTGDGNMILEAPLATERRNLKLLTKSDEFSENFSQMVLRFTDSTYDEVRKGGAATQGTCDAGLLRDSQTVLRKKLNYNLSARILEDVLRTGPGGLFVAFVHGKRYDDKLLYIVDPDGAPEASPEEVELMTYGEGKFGIWAAFGLSPEYRAALGAAAASGSRIHIEHQELDTTIESNATLTGKARTEFVALSPGMRVVPFDLHGTLRVQSVTGEEGQPLSFIQEDKNDDPDYYVILPSALARGAKYTVTAAYSGKDAVMNEGGGNYYPVARHDWYPSNAGARLGDYTSFDMIFRVPKGMKMAVSGSLLGESQEGGHSVTTWKTEVPQPVAGFQFGRMKEQDANLKTPEMVIATYANDAPPDWASHLEGSTMGNLSTVSMMKGPLIDAQNVVPLYTEYFGPLPIKRLALTQQTACNYGQSWPGLIWLPICSFFDSTVRHQLGLDWADRGYWDVVTPHEIAHQWWGHLVGFRSYRDQWMSEGFADFSASLYLQRGYGKESPKVYAKFWNDERTSIVEKNKEGFRAIDVGPVTMGYRLNNAKAGFNIARNLIYPKGAYILHMIRMMMWDSQAGDQHFKETMRDFTQTYAGRSASTENFKSLLEKHMTREMNAAGDGKMDWFFNEYVYGTALPSYSFESSFEQSPAGDVIFAYKLTQSGVDDSFRMPVPVYLESADGHILFVGRIQAKGNATKEGKVPLRGMKDVPKRALINYNHDILAAVN